jgi:hypothetical protein
VDIFETDGIIVKWYCSKHKSKTNQKRNIIAVSKFLYLIRIGVWVCNKSSYNPIIDHSASTDIWRGIIKIFIKNLAAINKFIFIPNTKPNLIKRINKAL